MSLAASKSAPNYIVFVPTGQAESTYISISDFLELGTQWMLPAFCISTNPQSVSVPISSARLELLDEIDY